jgi:hypothetical protein
LTVDSPVTGDRYVIGVYCEDQMPRICPIVSRGIGLELVVVHRGPAEQSASFGEVQPDLAFQFDKAREEDSGGYYYGPPACLRNCVDGSLNWFGIRGFAVGLCTKFENIPGGCCCCGVPMAEHHHAASKREGGG